MKKFTLTLLLLLAGIPTLFAQQTVRNDIFAYLKHEAMPRPWTRTRTSSSKSRESSTTLS